MLTAIEKDKIRKHKLKAVDRWCVIEPPTIGENIREVFTDAIDARKRCEIINECSNYCLLGYRMELLNGYYIPTEYGRYFKPQFEYRKHRRL